MPPVWQEFPSRRRTELFTSPPPPQCVSRAPLFIFYLCSRGSRQRPLTPVKGARAPARMAGGFWRRWKVGGLEGRWVVTQLLRRGDTGETCPAPPAVSAPLCGCCLLSAAAAPAKIVPILHFRGYTYIFTA